MPLCVCEPACGLLPAARRASLVLGSPIAHPIGCPPAALAVDPTDAKRRFRQILFETVVKREQEYGFELDADDIKQVETVLRVKYCGPQGLIGPC